MNQIVHHSDIFRYLCRFVGTKDIANFLRAFNPGCSALVLFNRKEAELDIIENTPCYYFKCRCGDIVLHKDHYDAQTNMCCHECGKFLCTKCKINICRNFRTSWCPDCYPKAAKCYLCNITECINSAWDCSKLKNCKECSHSVCWSCSRICTNCDTYVCKNCKCCAKCNYCHIMLKCYELNKIGDRNACLICYEQNH